MQILSGMESLSEVYTCSRPENGGFNNSPRVLNCPCINYPRWPIIIVVSVHPNQKFTDLVAPMFTRNVFLYIPEVFRTRFELQRDEKLVELKGTKAKPTAHFCHGHAVPRCAPPAPKHLLPQQPRKRQRQQLRQLLPPPGPSSSVESNGIHGIHGIHGPLRPLIFESIWKIWTIWYYL